MGNFVKNVDEIINYTSKPTTFYDAEILTAYWETKPEIIEHLLPQPLKPAKRPLVSAFIANYPRTNFCPGYLEAALFILSDFNGEIGTYCLSMPISDGMAMALGREIYGFPKKMAEIQFKKNGDIVEGSVSRNGIEFFNIKTTLNENFNTKDAKEIIGDYYGDGLPIYNFKYSKSPDGKGYDLNPRLVKQDTTIDTKIFKTGQAQVSFKDSPHDPWIELEIVRILGCTYNVGTSVLLRGITLAEADPNKFVPYSYTKWDWWENNL